MASVQNATNSDCVWFWMQMLPTAQFIYECIQLTSFFLWQTQIQTIEQGKDVTWLPDKYYIFSHKNRHMWI